MHCRRPRRYIYVTYTPFTLQYIRKMSKLLQEGRLPSHVNPEDILHAEPSKRRPGENPGSAVEDPLVDKPPPDDSGANSVQELEKEATTKKPPKKKARTRSPSTSETEASLSYDDGPSFDADDFSHLIRSSSGEECD